MAISRDDVLRAVEQYLPRTVNFAQSEDLGERDTDAIFARIMQIVLSSLLVDQDAIFYVIYLSAQRLRVAIESAIAILEQLESIDELRGVV